MIRVSVQNTIKSCPVSASDIKKAVTIARIIEPKIVGEVEVILVGVKRMQTLNRHFRGLNRPTDVLSFAWQEDPYYRGKSLGQVYLCYTYIVRQAQRFKVAPREECIRMLAHGLLHVVGHDHQAKKEAKKMFLLQERIVKKVIEQKL